MPVPINPPAHGWHNGQGIGHGKEIGRSTGQRNSEPQYSPHWVPQSRPVWAGWEIRRPLHLHKPHEGPRIALNWDYGHDFDQNLGPDTQHFGHYVGLVGDC